MSLSKLTALSKLANAYHYIEKERGFEYATLLELEHVFNWVRRSLRIEDLKPVKDTEGLNGRMPTQF